MDLKKFGIEKEKTQSFKSQAFGYPKTVARNEFMNQYQRLEVSMQMFCLCDVFRNDMFRKKKDDFKKHAADEELVASHGNAIYRRTLTSYY